MHSNSLDLTTKATFLLQRLNSTSSYEKGDIFELITQVFSCLENILLWASKKICSKTLSEIVKMKYIQKNFRLSGLTQRKTLQPQQFQLPPW